MSRNNGRARRDERYRSAVQRQLAFLAGEGTAVVTRIAGHHLPRPVPLPYAPIEEFLRPGDTADRHARGCEPCGGEGEERWPNTAKTGNAWIYSGKPCPDCKGEGVAA